MKNRLLENFSLKLVWVAGWLVSVWLITINKFFNVVKFMHTHIVKSQKTAIKITDFLAKTVADVTSFSSEIHGGPILHKISINFARIWQ